MSSSTLQRKLQYSRVSTGVFSRKYWQHDCTESELPVITASIDNGICRTDMSEYMGCVVITVENAAGDTIISHTESVCDSTQFDTDVSSLIDGEYTITYTLEDSTVFCGEFEKI